jgi:hypothetical protein
MKPRKIDTNRIRSNTLGSVGSVEEDEMALSVYRSQVRQGSPKGAQKGYVNHFLTQKKMNQSFYKKADHPNYSPRVT